MNVLVIDSYIGFEHARKLSQDGNKVYYFCEYAGSLEPQLMNYVIGYGFNGIEKVPNYDNIDKADLVVIPDIGFGGIADYLRKQGKKVFGGGLAEKLEMNRIYAKEVLKKLGIKYSETVVIKGINDVLDYFEKNDYPHIIKFNTFRGDMETIEVKGYDDAMIYLDWLSPRFGPFLYTFPFIIEKKIDGMMIGVDTMFNGKDFIEPIGFGLEIDANCIESWDSMAVEIFKEILFKIKKVLQEYNYRGALSIEGMWDGDDLYIIDFTIRFPYPLSLMYCEYFDNYTEVLYKVASGEKIKIDIPVKYTSIVNLYSSNAKDMWLLMKFPDDIRIRFRRVVKVDDNYYSVPPDELVCSVIGGSNNLQSAINQALNGIKKVDVLNSFYKYDVDNDFNQVVKDLEMTGYKF